MTGGWRQVQTTDDVVLSYREYPGSAIPEFRASTVIEGSRSSVISVMTDFGSWPEWVYRCDRAQIIQTRGYEEAWIHQVTDLPVVRDRDVIMHAVIRTIDGDILIEVEAAPDFCDDKESSSCRETDGPYVRVTQMKGTFRIRRHDDGKVEVLWQQYLDPNGLIPAWMTRMMLDDIPIRSLQRLKQIVEQEG
ncbi:MAG: hypothetical protein HUJ31_18300 [Pseudomonadales bacterium]|nr:hypothetical protein [Pseudomonadales bacterium]